MADNNSILEMLQYRLREYLTLKGIHVNRNGYAHCPFHEDKRPSFNVSGPKGNVAWNCFSCGRAGDIFDLAHELEGLPAKGSPGFMKVTVPELAQRFGLKVEMKPMSEKERKIHKLYKLHQDVAKLLTHDEPFKQFAKERQFSEDILKRFGVGYSKSYRRILLNLKKKYDEDLIEEAGLVKSIFENRIVFPLYNKYGQIVAFAGRALDDEQRFKYVNSATTKLYKKSTYMYHLNVAHQYDSVYVVEGYLDVIRMASVGILNVVAIGGVSITDAHINELKKFKKVVLMLDSDKAGIEKTSKIKAKVPEAYVVMLPKGLDPDNYIRDNGVEAFLKLPELDDLSWRILTAQNYQKEQLIAGFIDEIIKANPAFHERYLRQLARRSGIYYSQIKSMYNKRMNQISWKLLSKLLKDGSSNHTIYLNVTIGGDFNET